MKKIYLSGILVDDMSYRYNDLSDPIENLKYYSHIKFENEDSVYYREDVDDYDEFFPVEGIKEAYEKTEHIFKEMDALETGNDREYYLYSIFGENLRTLNIFNAYMRGNEAIAKRKTFLMELFKHRY